MKRVLVDTNVLFPFSVMDLMLALTEDGIHEVIWTERLLAEWERVIVREQHRSPQAAAAIAGAIREFFWDSRIDEVAYAPLVDRMPGKDPDDRHHIAAAHVGRAHAIVTWNRADFPAEALSELGLAVLGPDDYLWQLSMEFPDEVRATLLRMSETKRRPPMTAQDLLTALAKAGVPRFAGSISV